MPRVGISHSVLGPPASIRSQENVLQMCLQANHMESISQLRLSLSQMSLVWANWQKPTSAHPSGTKSMPGAELSNAEDRRIKWLLKFILG